MLLIATAQHELAADYLILRLEERGRQFQRFNTEGLGDGSELEITCGEHGSEFFLRLDSGALVRTQDVSGVYFHHPRAPSGPVAVAAEHCDFAENELLETLKSLWRLIPEERWLNHPHHLWRAENKVEQLAVARRCGFKVPDTLITRCPDSVARFIRKHQGHVIVKAVHHGFIMADEGMLLAGTQRIGLDYADRIRDYAAVPAVYQEAVSRRYDVRAVVVDENVFAVAIDGSNLEADWRIAEISGEKLAYSWINLPRDVEQACISIVREFGLRYSSIDLINAPDGKYIFLELNPSGQWAWLEQITGCPIRDAIIDVFNSDE